LGRAHGRAASRDRRGQRRLDAGGAEFREEKLMWRILHILAIGAVISSAAYVYSVKYQAIYASEQVVKTRHAIAKERDAINVLRAEYAHLIRPDRLQALADKLLDMQPLALNQIAKAGDLPLTAAKVDSIGRKLEALGLGQSATPSAGVTGATPALR
jgi:cell division protein FtsL